LDGKREGRYNDSQLSRQHTIEEAAAAPWVAFRGNIACADLQLEKVRDRLVQVGFAIVA